MAYTQLGTPAWGTGPKINLTISYDRQRAGANMQYKIKVVVAALPTTGSAYFGYPIYASIDLDESNKVSGHQIKAASPDKWNSAYTYETSWLTVSNKTTGTTSLAVKIYSGSGSSRSATYNYSLAVDLSASTMTVGNGTLGQAQTITLTKYNSNFVSTITAKAGNKTQTIATKTSATSISWTPDASFAAESPNDPAVAITLTCETFTSASGSSVGSTKATSTQQIPPSVVPTVSMALSDPTGKKTTFGSYIQAVSKILIALTAAGAQGSTISSYAITVSQDGSTVWSFSENNVTTPEIPVSGTLTVSATVKDSRGRTGSASSTVSVTAYTSPTVTKLTAVRCSLSGTDQADGGYCKVVFSASITPLSNRNTAAYKVAYRQKGTSSWTEIDVSSAVGNYSPSNVQTLFEASGSYAFEVRVVAIDAMGTKNSAVRTIPIAFVTMDISPDGTGVAFGRKSLNPGQLDIDMVANFLKGVIMSAAAFHSLLGADNVSIAERTSYTITVEDQALYLISTGTASNTRHGVWIAHTTGFNGSSVYVDTLVNPGTSDVSVTGGSGSITISNNAAQYSLRALYVRLF